MAVIRRLPKYHRRLKELLDKDVTRISSKELSTLIGFTASQIRQDLNCFGGFGQQGYGYDVAELYAEISRILGLTEDYNTIIIGAGNLGQAIANYSNFEKKGFHMLALFEKNPRLIGLQIREVPVLDIEDLETFCKDKKIDIGVICTNKESAQDVEAEAGQHEGKHLTAGFGALIRKVFIAGSRSLLHVGARFYMHQLIDTVYPGPDRYGVVRGKVYHGAHSHVTERSVPHHKVAALGNTAHLTAAV